MEPQGLSDAARDIMMRGGVPGNATQWVARVAKGLEAHYRTLWALDADAPGAPCFPEHYPVSCVLGRVSVVACVTQSQLRRAAHRLAPSLRDESGSSFAFCCERPQMLPLPVAGRSGEHKIWELTSAEAKGFSLALVDALYGREKADELAAQMLVAYPS